MTTFSEFLAGYSTTPGDWSMAYKVLAQLRMNTDDDTAELLAQVLVNHGLVDPDPVSAPIADGAVISIPAPSAPAPVESVPTPDVPTGAPSPDPTTAPPAPTPDVAVAGTGNGQDLGGVAPDPAAVTTPAPDTTTPAPDTTAPAPGV